MSERVKHLEKGPNSKRAEGGKLDLVSLHVVCLKDESEKLGVILDEDINWISEWVQVYLRPGKWGRRTFAMKSLLELHKHACPAKKHHLMVGTIAL